MGENAALKLLAAFEDHRELTIKEMVKITGLTENYLRNITSALLAVNYLQRYRKKGKHEPKRYYVNPALEDE